MPLVTVASPASQNAETINRLTKALTDGGVCTTLQAASQFNDLGQFCLTPSTINTQTLESEFENCLDTIKGIYGSNATVQSQIDANANIDNFLVNGDAPIERASASVDIQHLAAEKAARTMMALQNENALLDRLKGAPDAIAAVESAGLGGSQHSANASTGVSWKSAIATLQDFNRQDYDQWKELTIDLNYFSSLISPATELAFRTVQLNGNFEGITTVLERDVIQRNTINPMTGEPMAQGRINALKAFRDMSLLKNNSNELLTNVQDKNKDLFVDHSIYTPVPSTDMMGRTFNTSYIKVGTGVFNLMDLCRVPGEMVENRQYTYMDAIAPNMRVGSLLVKVGTDKYVELDISNYQSGIYSATKTSVTNSQTEQMNAQINHFILRTDVKDVKGGVVTALKSLADKDITSVSLSLLLNGTLDHNGNNATFGVNVASLNGIYSVKKPGINQIADTTLATEVKACTFEVVGWKPRGNKLDTTYTQFGTIGESQDIQYPYVTRPQSMLTAHCPLGEKETSRQRRLRTLSTLAVAQTDARAMEFLLSYADRLNNICNGSGLVPASIEFEQFDVQSSGSFYMNPWCMLEEVTIQEICDTFRSTNRWEDMQSAILNIVRDRIPRMLLESQYVDVLRRTTNNPTARAKLGVITSKILAQYLFTVGDDRTLGAEQSDYENKLTVAISNYREMDERLLVFPITSGSGQFDQFHFGCRVSGISLITETERDMGGQGKFAVLQTVPFEEFYVTSPILYGLTVKGIMDFVATSAPLKVDPVEAPAGQAPQVKEQKAQEAKGGKSQHS